MPEKEFDPEKDIKLKGLHKGTKVKIWVGDKLIKEFTVE